MHHLIWFHTWAANILFIMCLHHPLGLLIHAFCDIVADTLIRIFIFCQLIETNGFVEAFEYGRNFEHLAFSLLLFQGIIYGLCDLLVTRACINCHGDGPLEVNVGLPFVDAKFVEYLKGSESSFMELLHALFIGVAILGIVTLNILEAYSGRSVQ